MINAAAACGCQWPQGGEGTLVFSLSPPKRLAMVDLVDSTRPSLAVKGPQYGKLNHGYKL